MTYLQRILPLLLVLPLTISAADVSRLPRDAGKEAWVRSVIAGLGLPNNIRVVRDDSLAGSGLCAFATISGGIQYIAFDPNCISTPAPHPPEAPVVEFSSEALRYWWSAGILLHEVGHQLAAHTAANAGKTARGEDQETEEWVGWAFARSGASLAEALVYATQSQEHATATHISRIDRMKAVEKGWRLAAAQMAENPDYIVPDSLANANPNVAPLASAVARQLRALRTTQ